MKTVSPRASHRRFGFTLAEVLAALTLMAIVIPVAMEGMSIASRAGSLGQRKTVATRVAQRVLSELIATGQIVSSGQSGTASEDTQHFDWRMETEAWSVDALELVTVTVSFQLQGSPFEVSVSTLHDPAAAATVVATGL